MIKKIASILLVLLIFLVFSLAYFGYKNRTRIINSKRLNAYVKQAKLFLRGKISIKKIQFKKDESKKLTFWSIQLKPIYEEQMNAIIADFEKAHPDYKVVWVDIPIQEAQKRTLASILSSTPPDLINLNPDFSIILAQRNALEFFEDDELEQFHPELLSKLEYNGKIYALPYYATSPVTIYNKEIYKRCIGDGFVQTFDELYNNSKKILECSKVPSFVLALNENDTLARILNKYNAAPVESKYEKQNAQKVYSMFDDMYKKGYLPKDILTINHREVIEKYMSESALITVAGSNFINMIKQNAPDVYKKSDISPQLTTLNSGYDVSLMNLVIPKKSKNKELAKEFAFILTNKENQLEFAKLTNVLSVNKYALEDEFFKNCSSDLVEKSRCLSVKQLDNLNIDMFGDENKKTINETINKTLEEILLNESSKEQIEQKINDLSKELEALRQL